MANEQKKKFQAWVDDEKVEMLDKTIDGVYGSRVEWLNDVIDRTITGEIKKSCESSLSKILEPTVELSNYVGLSIQEDKYFMLQEAAKKLGFEDVSDWLDRSIENAVIDSKQQPEVEIKEVECNNLIAKARKQRKLTQTDIAKMIGIDRSYYNLIENGFRLPSMDLISKIGRLIGLSLEEFYAAHKALGKR